MLLWILIVLYVVLSILVNIFVFKQFNVVFVDNDFVKVLGIVSKWVLWPAWIIFWIVFGIYMHFKMTKVANMHKPKASS